MATQRICSLPGCNKQYVANGYCNMHRKRFKRYGDPIAGRSFVGSNQDFLHSLIGTDRNDCIQWPFGERANGYGLITYQGKNWNASRLMCEIAHGSPPQDGMVAAHSCGNGHEGCVNPRHIRWASVKENHDDQLVHGTRRTKLTEQEVREIRALRGQVRQSDVAKLFGVSPRTISVAQGRKTWRHVD